MSDIEILEQMINPNAKIPLKDQYRRKAVDLVEYQCPDSSVTVSGIPNKTIVIKADAFKSSETFFNGSHGECKRSDFIIVTESQEKNIIIFIEMKRKKGTRKEIIQQLKGSQCLLVFCREIGINFWCQRDFLKGFAYRFVSVGHISLPKRKTRITRKSGTHDQPDKMMTIDWPHHLEFMRIAG